MPPTPDLANLADLADLEISGLSADSRAIRPGWLFAALPGRRADGRVFIDQAIANGAAAVLAPPGTKAPVPVIADPLPRRRLALMAARFFGRQPDTVVAVTGTNGKTSTVSFARQLWRHLGRPAGSLGTVGAFGPGFERPGNLTTPDPVLLHDLLAQMAEAGTETLAMEASSHGLDQHRLDGVRLAAAAFTNLSRDHLDYHADMAAYRAAKFRLFEELLPPGAGAVLNADVGEYPELREICDRRGLRVISYGMAGGTLRLEQVEPTRGGQKLVLRVLGRRHTVLLPVAGQFQAMNALAALGLVLAAGAEAEAGAAVEALHHLSGVSGRMERVAVRANGAAVYVDYAHTPDALEIALEALRHHVQGRLSVVFGCGGDRDPGKRAPMGEIAARLADRVIVSDDNPRGEDPAAIRAAILAAAPGAVEIGDRGAAIRRAVAELAPRDVLLIAGKGHESGQIVGDAVLPFDDSQAAREAVRRADEGTAP
nr:UDP-N-acetylmuramoyl-L-alanyl-D-glutamate--2,6-diaminopimelate ligase [Roseospirillum parvum]